MLVVKNKIDNELELRGEEEIKKHSQIILAMRPVWTNGMWKRCSTS